MNSTSIAALAIALAFGAVTAIAGDDMMSKEAYKAEKNRIDAVYKSANDRCKGLSGNANDICKADAKGHQKVALAELDARNKNTPKAFEQARMVRADAEYEIAKERCDDLAGNRKDTCLEEAKAAQKKAKADAKADRQAMNAQDKANQKIADARKDAAETRRDADYRVAIERCDTFAGDRKDACVKEAKARFGK